VDGGFQTGQSPRGFKKAYKRGGKWSRSVVKEENAKGGKGELGYLEKKPPTFQLLRTNSKVEGEKNPVGARRVSKSWQGETNASGVEEGKNSRNCTA